MKWVLNFNKKNKWKYHLSNILLIFFDSLGFIGPILVGYLVDEGIMKQNEKVIIPVAIFAVIFTIIKTLGSYLSVIQLDKVGALYEKSIKEKCYDKFQSLDIDEFQSLNKGELLTVFTEDARMANRYISYFFKTAIALSLSAAASIIVCFFISVKLTIAVLIVIPIITGLSYLYLKVSNKNYKAHRKNLSKLNGYIRDNIEGNKVVRTFAKENTEYESMTSLNSKLKDNVIELNTKNYLYFGVINFFSNFTIVIFILVGGLFLIKGEISVGQFIMFETLIGIIKEPFIQLGELMDRHQRFKISQKKIIDFLNVTPKVVNEGKEKLDSLFYPIELKNVSISYGDKTIVKNLNIKIPPKKTIAFIGGIGEGKSSIVNLLLRFTEPSAGEVLIDGKNIKQFDLYWLRSNIGYVPQQPFLFSDTIKNNIEYGSGELSKEYLESVSKASKLAYVEKFPDKIETIIGERGAQLSGGEKQRLSLARALAIKPDLLILDDITSALDIETERFITNEINNLDFECTKIIIAQKIVSVKNADYIYVIGNSKVAEEGTHEELLKKKGYYYEIYKLQSDILEEGDICG